MRYAFLTILLMTSTVYAAQVFQSTDSAGNIVYSDVPSGSNTTVVNTNNTNVVSAPSQQAPRPSNAPPSAGNVQLVPGTTPIQNGPAGIPTGPKRVPYTTFAITMPANGATIQNQPVVSVTLNVVPPLQQGDYIQVYLDGQTWGQPQASPSFQFTAPSRGTHTVSAKLFNKDNAVVMSTGANTIYVHQAALGGAGTAR